MATACSGDTPSLVVVLATTQSPVFNNSLVIGGSAGCQGENNWVANTNNTHATLMLDNVTKEAEITLLSPSSPHPEGEELENEGGTTSDPTHLLFAQKLQMKLKSHLESESSSNDDYFAKNNNSNNSNSSNNLLTTDEDDISSDNNTNSSSEIFYDFDDVVIYDDVISSEDIATSDYGTGGSNSTIVASSRDGSVIGESSIIISSSSSSPPTTNNNVVIEESSTTNKTGYYNSAELNKNNDDEQEEEGETKTCNNNNNNSKRHNNNNNNNPRYQRSSSLKSGKTPPGTPMKKIVRFADAMGLDLIDIKVFMDELPKIPPEAYRDLHIPDFNNSSSSSNNSSFSPSSSSPFDFYKPFSYNMSLNNSSNNPARNISNSSGNNSGTLLNFVPLFHQPVTLPDFFDKIRDQKVLLENAYLTQETISNDDNNTPSQNNTKQSNNKSSSLSRRQFIKGTVRVINLDFHKSVYIRYSYNDWKEFYDFQATYLPGSCDGFSDRFEFRIQIDESKLPPFYAKEAYDDAKITFACRFHCQGTQFWDNNQSRNYVFQNVPVIKSSNNNSSSSTTTTNAAAANSISPMMISSNFLASTKSRYASFDEYDYNNDPLYVSPNNKDLINNVVNSLNSELKKMSVTTTTTTTEDNNSAILLPPTTTLLRDEKSCGVTPTLSSSTNGGSSNNHGGGSHLSNSLYSPTSFYESAYTCPYSNNYGSACFY